MFELKDFTLVFFIKENLHRSELAKILKENFIYDYEALDCFIKSGHPDFQKKEFQNLINKQIERIKNFNKCCKTKQVYSFEVPAKYSFDISFTDRSTKLSEIFIPANPYKPQSSYYLGKKDFFILDIKYLASKLDENGNNALIRMFKYMGDKRCKKLIWNIDFYNEQLIRTMDSYRIDPYENAFQKDLDLKIEWVTICLPKILEYLMSNGNDFIWGPISAKQKLDFENCFQSDTIQNKTLREFIISLVSRYTTLEENEIGLIRSRALDRFIKK